MHLTPVRVAITKRTKKSVDEDVEIKRKKNIVHYEWECNLV